MVKYFDSEKIDNRSWKDDELVDYEYEYCVFRNCDFSGTSILSSSYLECEFHNCNFSLTNLSDTILNDVRFYNCKILGVKFDVCSSFIFNVYFADSTLDYSSFEKRKMPKTTFLNCSLKGVSFVDAELKSVIFNNCNLDEAIFSGSNLQEANFTTAYNYTINLDDNFVRKTRFSKEGLSGLLKNHDIIIE